MSNNWNLNELLDRAPSDAHDAWREALMSEIAALRRAVEKLEKQVTELTGEAAK